MMFIATFYSHFGAMKFRKFCQKQGWVATLSPVPRDLSSSCGTCVRFTGRQLDEYPEDVEQVVMITDEGYKVLYRAENS